MIFGSLLSFFQALVVAIACRRRRLRMQRAIFDGA
jgi:hypothetical protein